MSEGVSGAFERSLEELEKIVGRLEREDLSLDESVNLFKTGRELAANCERMLTDAQKAVDAAIRGPAPLPEPVSLDGRARIAELRDGELPLS